MDDKSVDRLSAGAVVGSASLADLLSQVSGNPTVAGMLGAAAAAIGVGLDSVNQRRREKAVIATAIGARESGLPVDSMIDKLLQDNAKTELLATVLEGAAKAIDRRKLIILGRTLASSATSDDGTKLHHEIFTARLISDLELPHLRILKYMERDPSQEGSLRVANRLQILELHEPRVLGYSLLATLMEHALLEGYSHAEFERAFGEKTRRRVRVNEHTAEPVVYTITTLGTYALGLYADAAAASTADDDA